MKLQLQTVTIGGEVCAIVPLAEYDVLREDLEDAAAAAALRRLRIEGNGEALPEAFVDRLIDGEHPVRVWRDYRGLKARALAEAASVSPSYLSDIESGRKPGSTRALKRLAAVLDVDMDELVP